MADSAVTRLSVPLLARILRLSGHESTVLTVTGRKLSEASRICLYERVIVPDDDRLLLLATEHEAPSSLLKSVLSRRIYAKEVRSLTIVSADDEEATPLDDRDLVDLTENLRLEHFSWAVPRLPSRRLARAIASMTRLAYFSLSLEGDAELRYDGDIFDYLPASVTRLELADLSQAGTSALGLSVSALLNLRTLRIERTRFVDDTFMEALAGCTPLRALSLIKMGGTKLTDTGIASILESSNVARLELVDVQGRLTKSCWSKVTPKALQALVISLSEDGDHHSWTNDHFESLSDIVKSVELVEFVVNRLISPDALQAGEHFSTAIHPQVEVKPLPQALLRALLHSSASLKKLDIDFWQTRLVDTQQLMLTCRGLEHLKVMIDQPFNKLTMLPSPLAGLPRLKELLISIPPALTPVLKDLYHALGSADQRPGPEELLAAAQSDDTLPTIKDFRKFIKKATSLETVAWTGRGGVATYELSKGSSSLVKIAVKPISVPQESREPVGSWASQGLDGIVPSKTRPPRTPSPSLDEDDLSTPALSTHASTTPASSSPPRMRRQPVTSPSLNQPYVPVVPINLTPLGEKKAPGWGKAKKKPASPKIDKAKDKEPETNRARRASAPVLPSPVTPGSSRMQSLASSTKATASASKTSGQKDKEPISPPPRRVVPGMKSQQKKKTPKSGATPALSSSPIKRSS